MIRFLLQRLFQGVIVIVLVISITFLMIRLAPGSPFAKERQLPEYARANLEKLYGLDSPIIIQLGRNLWNFAKLEMPVSFRLKGWTVGDIIKQAAPVSFTVGGSAFLIAVALGIPIGGLAAIRAGRFQDRSVMAVTTLGISVPSLVLGPLIAVLFGTKMRWFNAAGWYDSGDWVLPSLTLGLISAATVARLTRSGLREALSQDFIRTARAKGLAEKRVVFLHAFKVACLPLLNYLGPMASGLLSGAFITETVFQLPGLGRHFISSALHQDYTLAMGLAAMFAAMIVGFNLLVDILQAWINPRIRLIEK